MLRSGSASLSYSRYLNDILTLDEAARVLSRRDVREGNIALWLVPPIRRVFEAEARDHPGTSIGASMRGLLRIGVWVFPIGLATAFFAAYFLDSLR